MYFYFFTQNSMQIAKLTLALGALVLVGAGCAGAAPTTTHSDSMATQPAGTPAVNDTPSVDIETLPPATTETPEDTESPIAPGEPNPDTPTEVLPLPNGGVYEDYSEDKLSRAETGTVVLFFQASWCPSCRALDSDIKKNLTDIPSDVSILRLDYDKETELKKKYGVRSQHTFVQVDSNGEAIHVWRGGNRLSDIVKGIQ